MKRSSKHFLFLCFYLFSILFYAACGSKKAETGLNDCPFTEIEWDNTAEEIFATEGKNPSSYDSVYGGTCYTYPKEYEGHSGTVKYMFDDQERLMCIAWTYTAKDSDELSALYDDISTAVNEQYGESGYDADNPGNSGNVWYLESGDIVLSVMRTSETNALQYAYLHPLVSNTEAAAE